MKVTVKLLITYCDSVYKQNINQRKCGFHHCSIFPRGKVPVRVKCFSMGNCFIAAEAWREKNCCFFRGLFIQRAAVYQRAGWMKGEREELGVEKYREQKKMSSRSPSCTQ